MTTARTTINRCLGQFASALGAHHLELNEAGVCAFTYDEKFEVVIEVPEESSQVYFYAPVIPLPTEDRLKLADLFAGLLQLNAFSALTQGATVALDPQQPRILLCFQYPVDALDETRFYNLVTHFTQALQALHAKLTEQEPSSAPPIPDPAIDPMYLYMNRV